MNSSAPRASESFADAAQSILSMSSPGWYGREPATSEPEPAAHAVQASEREPEHPPARDEREGGRHARRLTSATAAWSPAGKQGSGALRGQDTPAASSHALGIWKTTSWLNAPPDEARLVDERLARDRLPRPVTQPLELDDLPLHRDHSGRGRAHVHPPRPSVPLTLDEAEDRRQAHDDGSLSCPFQRARKVMPDSHGV